MFGAGALPASVRLTAFGGPVCCEEGAGGTWVSWGASRRWIQGTAVPTGHLGLSENETTIELPLEAPWVWEVLGRS